MFYYFRKLFLTINLSILSLNKSPWKKIITIDSSGTWELTVHQWYRELILYTFSFYMAFLFYYKTSAKKYNKVKEFFHIDNIFQHSKHGLQFFFINIYLIKKPRILLKMESHFWRWHCRVIYMAYGVTACLKKKKTSIRISFLTSFNCFTVIYIERID